MAGLAAYRDVPDVGRAGNVAAMPNSPKEALTGVGVKMYKASR